MAGVEQGTRLRDTTANVFAEATGALDFAQHLTSGFHRRFVGTQLLALLLVRLARQLVAVEIALELDLQPDQLLLVALALATFVEQRNQ